MKQKWYLIPAVMFLACIVLAVVVRFSYTNHVANDINSYLFESGTNDSLKTVLNGCGIQDETGLINQSDIIVKAKFDGDRLVKYNAFYSTVRVQDVYKGDKSLKGQNVIVTENVSVFQTTKFLNCSSMPMWVPLNKGSEYLMLLKRIPFAKERALNDFQQKQYYPVTNSPAGCYLFEHGKKTVFSAKAGRSTLPTLAGMALYAENQQQVDEYYQMKDQVLKQLNITDD